jgi:hypothetical protein
MSSPEINRIYVPARGLEDWQNLLGDPSKHWKEGRSAMSLAYRWCAGDFPDVVSAALDGADIDAIRNLELLVGLPEHQVPLPPAGARPSQTDLFVLARSSDGLVAITVEGKVDEPFGKVVDSWLGEADGERRSGKPERLRFIVDLLGMDEESVRPLRYQLLHRTAAAVLEGKRFAASHALMLVHSFDSGDAGLSDFEAFAEALGADRRGDAIMSVPHIHTPRLYLGWVRDTAPQVDPAFADDVRAIRAEASPPKNPWPT